LDKLFYQRIRKYRADPSLSLIGNQVYDYYGEKINSLSGYRTWLRKQRLLKEKATIKLGAGNEKPIEIPLT
ncbi:TIM23 complex component, partial [Coelomomyces lativittatus]